MKPLVIIPADGESYLRYALVLVESIRVWQWPVATHIHTVSEAGGKAAKVGFYRCIPARHDGPVILLDADMVAVDVYPFVGCGGLTVAQIGPGQYDTCGVFFGSAAQATDIGAKWERHYTDAGSPRSDVPAFNSALADYTPATFNQAARVFSIPSLHHYCGKKSAYAQQQHNQRS